MKLIASLAASLLIAAVILSLLPVHGEEIVYENTVRFHVLAESDTDADQALKLKVRDDVLAYISPLLEDCTDVAEASALLTKERENIRAAAEKTIRENGYDYTVYAELVTERYPTRIYENISLPGGTYTSMKVTIGKGEGRNWWCVLFPSVCNSFSVIQETEDPMEDFIAAGFTPKQYRMIQKDAAPTYKVRFRILEMLSDLLGFSY